MLSSLFDWFDVHASSYWLIAACPTVLLLVWSVWQLLAQEKPSRARYHALVTALLVFGVLLAWRWPFLLSADEYNPDESQLIAGALTIPLDPVPWRGVDGFTSGPLNFYPLLVPHFIGLPLDYFTARLVGLVLIWGALLACLRLFSSWFGTSLGLIGILPALAFFSTITDANLIHYSSEHLSIFLTALSAFCILRFPNNRENQGRWQIAGCFTAGLLPLAKLQSGPLAVALVLVALFDIGAGRSTIRQRIRAMVTLVLAAALPLVAMLMVVAATKQFAHFSRSYVLQNFVYVGDGASLKSAILGLWRTSLNTGHFQVFLGISIVGMVFQALAKPHPKWDVQWVASPLLLIASVVCVLGARRALLHYLLLLTIPFTLCFGMGAGRWAVSQGVCRRGRGGLILLLCGILPFAFRATQPIPEMFGNFASHWREPYSPLGSLIRSYKSSESRLAVWGWLPSFFVETGLPQGTRDGNSSWAIIPSPHREYYRQRFLEDLRRAQPDFFVDAVGIGSRFFTDRGEAGHESYPALAEYIQQNYQLVADEDDARFYAKNGWRSPAVTRETGLRLQITNNHPGRAGALELESITPATSRLQFVRRGFAQMMDPPAEMVWALDATTREVIFEYGFLPESFRKDRTDGVELIFELRSPNAPTRHLFYRQLDPVHRSSDRGPVAARLVLPPFNPGAKLVARTTVGPAGNGAWDWIYLWRVRAIRLPNFSPAQFPRFNRVPDAADADLSYLLENPDENVLILHAPARLTYKLDGRESRVHFDYGFREGAYTKGGQTDGATFRVELQDSVGAAEILFEKHLDPLGSDADRGAHSADFLIPAGRAGAKLIIQIDPGKGNAWDWTFLNKFTLE